MASNGEGSQEHPVYGQEPVTVELLASVGHSLERVIAEIDEFSRALTAARMRVQRFTEAFDNPVVTEAAGTPSVMSESTVPDAVTTINTGSGPVTINKVGDGKVCGNCGAMMQRTGACYTCPSCGENDGCG